MSLAATLAPGTRAARERELQAHLDAAERLLAELDAEDGDPDVEPTLGSVAVDQWDDRRRWAAGGDHDEREATCEDEG